MTPIFCLSVIRVAQPLTIWLSAWGLVGTGRSPTARRSRSCCRSGSGCRIGRGAPPAAGGCMSAGCGTARGGSCIPTARPGGPLFRRPAPRRVDASRSGVPDGRPRALAPRPVDALRNAGRRVGSARRHIFRCVQGSATGRQALNWRGNAPGPGRHVRPGSTGQVQQDSWSGIDSFSVRRARTLHACATVIDFAARPDDADALAHVRDCLRKGHRCKMWSRCAFPRTASRAARPATVRRS